MPFVKVTDLAYGRLQSPSLDEAEEFLVHFGMVRSERTPNALYMRGTDPAHHLHVTHLGPSKFIGLAFFVDNEDDLKKLAKAPGASGIEHLEGPKTGLNHLSFEVQSIDDVMLGHEHLEQTGKYQHVWGIGRHVLGSQIYDYWKDPWGRVHEHWTDTDVLNSRHRPKLLPAEEGLKSQWGEPVPQEFITHAIP